MKSSDRFKICSQCDGKVPVEVVICPYCSSSLSHEGSTRSFSQKSSSENLANLYNPPYASQRPNPTSAMEEKRQEYTTAPKAEAKVASMDKNRVDTSEKSQILPISLLVVGSNLLVLGLMQLFLSDEGILNLEWDSHFWYVYSLAALPLIWFGIKSLKANSN